jgi:hypothetical protein
MRLEVMNEIVKPCILEKPIGGLHVKMYCCGFKENKKETTAF